MLLSIWNLPGPMNLHLHQKQDLNHWTREFPPKLLVARGDTVTIHTKCTLSLRRRALVYLAVSLCFFSLLPGKSMMRLLEEKPAPTQEDCTLRMLAWKTERV